jgi:hypothetical protein
MFNFLTKHVRAAAILKSVEIEGGSRTTITVPGMKFKKKFVIHLFHSFLNIVTGDPFVAIFYAHNNRVSEKKRQCATIFVNHLIVMGAMTIDGQKGEKFKDYVDSLEAVNASRGYFTVHNARTKVDNFLDRKVMKSETGEPGAYCCYLRYLHNNQSKLILEIPKF